MLQPLSQLDRAFRDTQVHRADGLALRDISGLLGLPQPSSIAEKHWRGALRAGAYAPRATQGTVFAFFERLLEGRQDDFVVSVAPGTPTTLTWVSGGAGGFTRHHVGRLVRLRSSLGEHVLWTTGPDFVANPNAVLGTLTVAPVGTALWAASPLAGLSGAEQATATVLPLLPIVSTPGPLYAAGVPTGTSGGKAAALLLLVKGVGGVPPSYLQPSAAARPAGQPFGGHLQPDAVADGNPNMALAPGPAAGLPHGMYLADDAQAELTSVLARLLASGIRGTVRATDFGYRSAGIWEP